MRITHYGGAGGVTGSKHLLETGQYRLLLDCGTFQGLPDVRARNRSLPFAPESIDHVILSHAHIDHCGMLPLLVKRGFTGSIFATPATRDVARYMLEDAAGIEEQDAAWRAKKHVGAPDEREPLFTREDIPAVIEKFVDVSYARVTDAWHEVVPGVRLKMYDAGHILGSAICVLELDTPTGPHRIAYTGDVGAPGTPLLYDPQVPHEPTETVMVEATYGSRQHDPLEKAVERLAVAVNKVVERRGKIIIPAFSLGRTQVLVYLLHKLTDEGRIPRIPVYVDSPLAVNLTQVFRAHEHDYDLESEADFVGPEHKPLAFRNLTYVQSSDESKQLNSKVGPYIIISASGMMTAGRVVHHLRHSISDRRNAVFITGYQAEGTLGRRILEGAKHIDLYGDRFEVNAQIEVFNEFSAHGDRQQLTAYLERFQGVQQVILVHGEPSQADEFRDELTQHHPNWDVVRPDEGDTNELVF